MYISAGWEEGFQSADLESAQEWLIQNNNDGYKLVSLHTFIHLIFIYFKDIGRMKLSVHRA